jgi:hypothetical protein
MAARKTFTRIDQKTRDKIQCSQLINRLNKHALSDEEIMTASQIRAAEILLKKKLPDLVNTTFEDADGNNTLPQTITVNVVSPT